MNQPEYRRAPRRKVNGTVLVTDTMTDQVVGQIGNLSETGMLLIASTPLVEDALYQFRFALPTPGVADTTVEVGAHLLWWAETHADDQWWAGFRFIGIGSDQLAKLLAWLSAPGGEYA
ncbi:MAG TPA: PilZ domain-containing protein [Lysobacter sp.]|nr:PilZ domain-containing protein [Lysobacter sp.]